VFITWRIINDFLPVVTRAYIECFIGNK